MTKLTCAERRALAALREFNVQHGRMPSSKELASMLCLSWTSPIPRMLRALHVKGAIRYNVRSLPVVLL